MTQAVIFPTKLPDHTELPEEDGTFVKNFQEHPQSIILTDSISPVLRRLHPDGQYAIAQDSGIYWRLTDPPERGCEAPDWFYVPNVPLGLWQGNYQNQRQLWLRWWDNEGNLLLTGEERAEIAEHERDRAIERAEQVERSQREAISRLSNMGLNSEQIATALNLSLEEVQAIAEAISFRKD